MLEQSLGTWKTKRLHPSGPQVTTSPSLLVCMGAPGDQGGYPDGPAEAVFGWVGGWVGGGGDGGLNEVLGWVGGWVEDEAV